MRVGDRLEIAPVTFGELVNIKDSKNHKRIWGRVAYVHPSGRWFLVVFQTPGGPLRECFHRSYGRR